MQNVSFSKRHFHTCYFKQVLSYVHKCVTVPTSITLIGLWSFFLFFAGTRFFRVLATDRDGPESPNGQITYSIVSTHNKFVIDPNTGWISTNAVSRWNFFFQDVWGAFCYRKFKLSVFFFCDHVVYPFRLVTFEKIAILVILNSLH